MDFAVDMETLGKHSGCVVLSVGLVVFNPYGIGVIDYKYWEPEIEGQLRDGLTIEADTLAWWATKESKAEREIFNTSKYLILINGVLEQIQVFVDKHSEEDCVSRIWCTGTDFDIAMLRYLYNKYQMKYPFDYRGATDLRTFCDALDFDRFEYKGPAHLKKHNALDDAVYLVHTVQEVYRTREVVKK